MRKVLYIFGLLTDDDVEWMAETGIQRRLRDGEVVIREGEPTGSLIFLHCSSTAKDFFRSLGPMMGSAADSIERSRCSSPTGCETRAGTREPAPCIKWQSRPTNWTSGSWTT
jgi:hypothetical protein